MAEVSLRPARPSDASDVALLINIATHGLIAQVWGREEGAAESYNPIEMGRLHVLRDGDDLSWRNATLAESEGEIAGLLLGYREADPPKPPPPNLPEFGRPFNELRTTMPGAWYVSMISVHLRWRGRGIGARLMEVAETKRVETKARGMSLIVEDINTRARRLYERFGFSVRGKRPMIPFPDGGPNGEDWLLMAKD
jgi:ribosomal protein S18 acetylase RimI-like enzyme